MGKTYFNCIGSANNTDQTIVKPILVWERETNPVNLLLPYVQEHANDLIPQLTDTSKDGNPCSPSFIHINLTGYRSQYFYPDVDIYSKKYSGNSITSTLKIWDRQNGCVNGSVQAKMHWCGWVWYEENATNDSDYRFKTLPDGGAFSLGPTDWWGDRIRFVYPYACWLNLRQLIATKLPFDDADINDATTVHTTFGYCGQSNPNTNPVHIDYVGGDNSNNPRHTKLKSEGHILIPDAYWSYIVGFNIANLSDMATGNPNRDMIARPFKLEGRQLIHNFNKYVFDWHEAIYYTPQQTGLQHRLGFAGFLCLTW